MKVFYSPLEAVRAWKKKRAGEGEKPKVIEGPAPGLIADMRLAVELAEAAEIFVKTKYHGAFVEHLENLAAKLFEDFEKGAFEKETYFKAAALLKDITEHPFRLIRGGKIAADRISEWDQQGLTEQVAHADASRAQGEHHGPV